MARQPIGENPKFFECKRLKIGGELGLSLNEIVKRKMKDEHRKNIQETVVAIIMDYSKMKDADSNS